MANWIVGAVKNKGGLHKALGIPQNKKIPKGKLSVKSNDSTHMKKMKNLARNLMSLRKG